MTFDVPPHIYKVQERDMTMIDKARTATVNNHQKVSQNRNLKGVEGKTSKPKVNFNQGGNIHDATLNDAADFYRKTQQTTRRQSYLRPPSNNHSNNHNLPAHYAILDELK